MSAKFTGTGVAVVTPFHPYGTIDFSALEKVLNHVILRLIYLIVKTQKMCH